MWPAATRPWSGILKNAPNMDPQATPLGLEVIILCCLDGFCSYAVAGLDQSFVIPAGVNKDTGAAFLDPKPIR